MSASAEAYRKKYGYTSKAVESPGSPRAEYLKKFGKNLLSAAVKAPGVSHLIALSDELAERGSRAAGGAISALREGDVLGAPGRYLSGGFRKDQPEAIEEINRLGFTESPVPLWSESLPGSSGIGARVARVLTSPGAAATAASTIATLPLDVAGGAALKGARAITQVPRVAKALDVARRVTAPVGRLLSKGYAMPYSMRSQAREVIRVARGKENLLADEVESYLNIAQDAIGAAAKKRGIPAWREERRVRSILELAHRKPGMLSNALPEEQEAFRALDRLRTRLPEMQEQVGLRATRLGAHLTEAERLAEPGYTPRYPTEKLSTELGLGGQRGRVEVSDLGTKVPGIRSEEARKLTSAALEKKLSEVAYQRGVRMKPREAMEPLVRAFQMRGHRAARSTANAEAMVDIAEQFGVPSKAAGRGFRPMKDLNVFGGFNKPELGDLADVQIHPELFKYLDEFTREVAPKNIPGLSGFLRAWKPLVTSVNPQFISRNFQWNGIIGWVRGNRDPRNWSRMAQVLSQNAPIAPVSGLKKTITRDAFRKELLENNIIGTGTVAEFGVSRRRFLAGGGEAVRRLAEGPARVGTRINQAGEDLARASFYYSMRRKGMTPKRAAEETIRTYFDYSRDAYTPFIQGARENLVPFLTWTRNILPLTFRTLAENPSAYAGFGAISRESSRAAGLPLEERAFMGPQYREVPIVATGRKGDEYSAMSLSQVGFYDVSRLTTDPGRWLMSQLTPALGVPLESAGIIKNAFTKKGAQDIVELPPAAAAFHGLNPEVAEKLGITVAAPGRAVGPQWINSILRLSGPLGTTAFDLFSDDPNARNRVLAWLSGVRVREGISPEVGKSIQAATQKKEEAEEARKRNTREFLMKRIQEETEE